MTRVGRLEVVYGVRSESYRIELWHDGLKKHRVIKGTEAEVVRRKAKMQADEWDERWQHSQSKERGRRDQEANKRLASERTVEAQRELEGLVAILKGSLTLDPPALWDGLKDRSAFPEKRPAQPVASAFPALQAPPTEPQPTDPNFKPAVGFLGSLVKSIRERAEAESRVLYEAAHRQWEASFKEVTAANSAALERHEAEVRRLDSAHRSAVTGWEERRAAYQENPRQANDTVDTLREAYRVGEPEAVKEFADLVLAASSYPDFLPKEAEVDYAGDTKILVVDYTLPAPGDLPTLKEVKYVASRDEFTEPHVSQAQTTKLYDDLLYQIVLRTIHELFASDAANVVSAVVFNGYVTSIDRATGKEVTACVLSLQAGREEFQQINLANVDPRACFKALKGVGSSKLHGLAAVAPIVQMRREDGRFVVAQEVANTLDESSNLAAMDWEDFEHLIREVFEKEFSAAGGEVKVTQASRDGGVDAVVFDPDLIRGGKIVIQAKRYTNTVGVNAVRDLYGTVMNEGANKGILVTTSDYGPDAYAFANGKPLVLLNGSNLLHTLERHGHKARIDMQEARRLAMNQPQRRAN